MSLDATKIQTASPPETNVSPAAVPLFKKILWPGLIVFASWIAFGPALHHEFVNWDDDKLLLNNQNYRGLGITQIRWMFTTFLQDDYRLGHYHPLTWLSFGADYVLWGMNPFGYHLTNMVLHVGNGLLFFFVAGALLRHARLWREDEIELGAAIAALVFAVHPLRTESVAWVTERRDVLSGFFFLLTILCYLRFHADGAGGGKQCGWYVASVLAYAASLLSKASAVGLPIVLLALDWYPLRRDVFDWGKPPSGATRRVWLEKVPFVIFAVLAAMMAVYSQLQAQAMATLHSHGIGARLLQSSFGLWFYAWKTLLPIGLSPFVPIPERVAPLAPLWLGSSALVVVVLSGVVVMRHRWPVLAVVSFYYAVMLAPVSGLFQSGPHLVADRNSYLPCLGFSLMVGAGTIWLRKLTLRLGSAAPVLVSIIGGSIIVVLLLLTRQQVTVWKDSLSLFSAMLKRFPDAAVPNVAMATCLAERGRTQESLPYFLRALREKPTFFEAHYGLGLALFTQGQFEQACRSFENALRLRPNDVQCCINLGAARLESGDLDRAVAAFDRAVTLEPQHAGALYNLGQAHSRLGHMDQAVRLWRGAAEASPASPILLENLAWHLATLPDDSLRNGPDAVRFAEQACKLTDYQDLRCLDALAAAYAEVARYDRAVELATQAARLAGQQHMAELARQLEERLELYRSHRPFRTPFP